MSRKWLVYIIVAMVVFGCTSDPSETGNYIDIIGVVVDQNDKPIEDAIVVVFLDNVEVARLESTPLKNKNFSCNSSSPASSDVDYNCYNFLHRIPRYADFDIDNNDEHKDVLANARVIKKNELVTFRSYDGRFLVIMVVDGQLLRNTLLLQSDNTIATPSEGINVSTPFFSSTIESISQATAPSNAQDYDIIANQGKSNFVKDWVKPFGISSIVSFLLLVGFNVFCSVIRNKNNDDTLKKSKVVDPQRMKMFIDGMSIQILGGGISTIVGGIILKIMGI